MVGCLGAVFDLAETFVYVSCSFADGLGEQFRIHEMGAGAGRKIATVLHQLHAAQVDLAVAFHSIFDGAAGLRESRRVQNDNIELLALFLQLRKQIEHIGTLEGDAVGKTV